MSNFSSLLKTFSAAAVLLSANAAFATTYSNSFDGSFFGDPSYFQMGEVLNLTSAGTLTDFSFYAQLSPLGRAGNLNFVVAGWSGPQAVGPAMYTSSNYAYNGGNETLAFSGINTQLAAGSYIAYLAKLAHPPKM